MKTLHKAIAVAFATTAVVAGNAFAQPVYDTPPRYVQANPAQVGTVESIDVVRSGRADSGNRAAGTILGGIVGGVVGHQIGSGRGNDAATVAGALGGAAVGHELAENRTGRDGYRVNVRLDNGGLRSFFQDDVNGLNVGDRVTIANDHVYRYAEGGYRNDDRAYRNDDRPYRNDDRAYRGDDRPSGYQGQGYYRDDVVRTDANGYPLAAGPDVRYTPDGRLDRRVYHYDPQGYRVDQWGNRYDAEGYWVDERGNRYEYQDPPMGDVPNAPRRPQ